MAKLSELNNMRSWFATNIIDCAYFGCFPLPSWQMKMKKETKGSFKGELRKMIYDLFEQFDKKPLNHKQIAGALKITDKGVRTLINQLLEEEKEAGKLKEVERGKYVLTNPVVTTYQGRIEINRYGKGYVSVEGLTKDIEIPKGKTMFALYGDTVEVSVNNKARNPVGKILRVVERSRREFVGILQQGKGGMFMLPSDKRVHVDFYISKEQLNGGKPGDKVLVQILDWDRPESSPFGRVTRVFGRPGDHQAEMHAIIAEYGLPYEFSAELEDFANSIPAGITKAEIAKRRDFREVTTFTIDPFDAKDFDDALSIQTLPNGNIEVGVHIADVSHYMTPNSPLEAEAFNRATSVYLVDRTIPMLPERLSNFLCSLRPNEEKLCFSAVFEMNAEAEIIKEWFGRTVIYSDRRFTYEEAQTIIEEGPESKGDFAKEILLLDDLAKKLRHKRFEEGSIDFSSEEVKFKLDEAGKPIGVYVKVMKDSNQLIEDFMLLANRRVAAFIGDPKSPVNSNKAPRTFVYRVHAEPDEVKLQQLRTFVKQLGYKLPRTEEAGSVGVIKSLMKAVDGQPEEGVIRTMAIRSMAKAEYSTDNIGHYGLAFDFYTHFTSPIRRYPDVMVHRLLQQYLDHGRSADERDYSFKCRHSSLMEKRAAEAERASIKFKQVEFMLASIGQVFEGMISGLAGWGLYVEVEENKCEGLVSMESLVSDHYEFDADRYVVYGYRTKHEYHMGDKVKIRVIGGDIQQRTLDYELVEEGMTWEKMPAIRFEDSKIKRNPRYGKEAKPRQNRGGGSGKPRRKR